MALWATPEHEVGDVMTSETATTGTTESVSDTDERTETALEAALAQCEDSEVSYHIRQALQHIESR